MKKLKIVLTGGGTAGHISPLLVVFQELRKRCVSLDVLYIGKKASLEEKLAKKEQVAFAGLPVSGFTRKFSVKDQINNMKTFCDYVKSVNKARCLLQQFQPDLVFASGGYVCAPVLHAACQLKIKTIIHEQNEILGLTTRLFKNKVDVLLLASATARVQIKRNFNVFVVGNPVDSSFQVAAAGGKKEELGFAEGEFLIVSFGGSLGARNLNNAVADVFLKIEKLGKVNWVHATGEIGYHDFIAKLRNNRFDWSAHKNLDVRKYIFNLPSLISAADLVISRAGAMTIAELQVAGKACILIPSPNVANNHQLFNATAIAKSGAGLVLEEKDLLNERLLCEINLLMTNRKILDCLGEKMAAMAISDAAEKICKIIENLFGET
ncbi:MAG: UDP-N-acetylglucosamine--N-acetylmuramyl-(pentapeptide) pyrophosphoryl-undecaprenol N-acetylglucosamine transferase [Oscillospiraceae bacterium]|nr:UDP-N-acetylglucosamine--N-acetylmuramyl-(pentapeptide) pyrophosphoryl-undecaprenol N-acetylglucosamine transferase [Oscillospiraceae bacterium]